MMVEPSGMNIVLGMALAVLIVMWRYREPVTHWYYYPERGEK